MRKENISEKRELIDWYESYTIGCSPTQEHVNHTVKSVKRQVFQSIENDKSLKQKLSWWKPIVVAASLLLVSGLFFWYIRTERISQANMDLLSTISPTAPQARITLDNGEVIDLQAMAIDSCLRVGNIEIIKDNNGQITYIQNDKLPKISGTNTIQTPLNANYTLVLSDGTTVLLNSNTTLKYPNQFGDGDRFVSLDGEAYFIVNKNTNKQKFIVKTPQQTTEVLGTKFNVKARNNQSTEFTTLEEGSLRVINNHTSKSELIEPGQQVELNFLTTKVQQIDLEPHLAWTKGYFYMDGSNTSEVLQEIAEWYGIDIIFTKNENRTTYKGKIPKNMSLDKLIQLLEFTDLKTKPTVEKDRIKLIIK